VKLIFKTPSIFLIMNFIFAASLDIIKKDWEENYAKFVPCKKLGIEENSEKCKEKWKEIDSFYENVCNGDFIEKYIFVSGNLG
jgi:hypothetical protein